MVSYPLHLTRIHLSLKFLNFSHNAPYWSFKVSTCFCPRAFARDILSASSSLPPSCGHCTHSINIWWDCLSPGQTSLRASYLHVNTLQTYRNSCDWITSGISLAIISRHLGTRTKAAVVSAQQKDAWEVLGPWWILQKMPSPGKLGHWSTTVWDGLGSNQTCQSFCAALNWLQARK